MAANAFKNSTFTLDDAATNTVVSVVEIYKTSSGTPAAGIGARITLGGEDSAGNAQPAVHLDGYLSTVTSTSETGAFKLRLINAGTFGDVVTITPTTTTLATALTSTVAAQWFISHAPASGASSIRFVPAPATTGDAASVDFFRTTNTSALCDFVIKKGDNSNTNSLRHVCGTSPQTDFYNSSGSVTITLAGATGNGTFTGDLAVNGGDFTSSATTFSLLNATVTTLNIGAGATTGVNIGNTAGPLTSAGIVIGPATTTSRASFRAPHGTAPSAPVDGDIWTTTAGLYVRINGATVGPLS